MKTSDIKDYYRQEMEMYEQETKEKDRMLEVVSNMIVDKIRRMEKLQWDEKNCS